MGYAFVEHDTGSALEVACFDVATREVIDLTGKTVTLRYILIVADDSEAPVAVEREMTLAADPTTGVARYQFIADELKPGTAKFEIAITDGYNVVTMLEPGTFDIRKRLA